MYPTRSDACIDAMRFYMSGYRWALPYPDPAAAMESVSVGQVTYDTGRITYTTLKTLITSAIFASLESGVK